MAEIPATSPTSSLTSILPGITYSTPSHSFLLSILPSFHIFHPAPDPSPCFYMPSFPSFPSHPIPSIPYSCPPQRQHHRHPLHTPSHTPRSSMFTSLPPSLLIFLCHCHPADHPLHPPSHTPRSPMFTSLPPSLLIFLCHCHPADHLLTLPATLLAHPCLPHCHPPCSSSSAIIPPQIIPFSPSQSPRSSMLTSLPHSSLTTPGMLTPQVFLFPDNWSPSSLTTPGTLPPQVFLPPLHACHTPRSSMPTSLPHSSLTTPGMLTPQVFLLRCLRSVDYADDLMNDVLR